MVLEGKTIRVSLGDQDSDTYFQATVNEDKSQYVGTWHYPESGPADATETIVYARVHGNGWQLLSFRGSGTVVVQDIGMGCLKTSA